MRRAAISIPANITEGFGRNTKSDKAGFMNIAKSSLEESRYYLILSGNLGFGHTEKLMSLLEEISLLLTTYTRAILTSQP
jgi:four helix bundle protein